MKYRCRNYSSYIHRREITVKLYLFYQFITVLLIYALHNIFHEQNNRSFSYYLSDIQVILPPQHKQNDITSKVRVSCAWKWPFTEDLKSAESLF